MIESFACMSEGTWSRVSDSDAAVPGTSLDAGMNRRVRIPGATRLDYSLVELREDMLLTTDERRGVIQCGRNGRLIKGGSAPIISSSRIIEFDSCTGGHSQMNI